MIISIDEGGIHELQYGSRMLFAELWLHHEEIMHTLTLEEGRRQERGKRYCGQWLQDCQHNNLLEQVGVGAREVFLDLDGSLCDVCKHLTGVMACPLLLLPVLELHYNMQNTICALLLMSPHPTGQILLTLLFMALAKALASPLESVASLSQTCLTYTLNLLLAQCMSLLSLPVPSAVPPTTPSTT